MAKNKREPMTKPANGALDHAAFAGLVYGFVIREAVA
jgi:hypothetical protein